MPRGRTTPACFLPDNASMSSLPVVDKNEITEEDPLELMDEIDELKKKNDITILAHFYVDGDIQDIADFTGDSLKLARDATRVKTSTILFSGVHFMGESAKIMNPEKKVLIPDLLAGCSLAESCPPDKLAACQKKLRDEGHPEKFMFHYGRMKGSSSKIVKAFLSNYGTGTVGNHTSICEGGKWTAQELTWGKHYDNWDFDKTNFNRPLLEAQSFL